eukprot:gnl/MRDRNA2_/MRDRNA2_119556_c0_seq1.p1 gnl/MRDRNA2_/MRDRNA2_119556_c0~~gnl/MRDRNA2_/MRDRNA2_119556_c0_seq1.p1  ORF type:complete len:107 (+),score=0.50 gnl/MRDRNA2_/MRDRNA2_119556_c0_seq1:142-462(+)
MCFRILLPKFSFINLPFHRRYDDPSKCFFAQCFSGNATPTQFSPDREFQMEIACWNVLGVPCHQMQTDCKLVFYKSQVIANFPPPCSNEQVIALNLTTYPYSLEHC